MTSNRKQPAEKTASQGDAEHIRSDASLDDKTSRAEVGPGDIARHDAKKEALRNAGRGDQFVVPSDLEDMEQRDAAPGTREQD